MTKLTCLFTHGTIRLSIASLIALFLRCLSLVRNRQSRFHSTLIALFLRCLSFARNRQSRFLTTLPALFLRCLSLVRNRQSRFHSILIVLLCAASLSLPLCKSDNKNSGSSSNPPKAPDPVCSLPAEDSGFI